MDLVVAARAVVNAQVIVDVFRGGEVDEKPGGFPDIFEAKDAVEHAIDNLSEVVNGSPPSDVSEILGLVWGLVERAVEDFAEASTGRRSHLNGYDAEDVERFNNEVARVKTWITEQGTVPADWTVAGS